MRISVRHRSILPWSSRSRAAATLPAVSTSSPIFSRVSSTSSRRSGSSSTTRTRAGLLGFRLMGGSGGAAGKDDAEAGTGARRLGDIFEHAVIAGANLAGDVQPEAGALGVG